MVFNFIVMSLQYPMRVLFIYFTYYLYYFTYSNSKRQFLTLLESYNILRLIIINHYYIIILDTKLKIFLYYILYFILHYIQIIYYWILTCNNYLLSVQTRYSLSPRKYILPFSCHLQHYRLKILPLFNKHRWDLVCETNMHDIVHDMDKHKTSHVLKYWYRKKVRVLRNLLQQNICD